MVRDATIEGPLNIVKADVDGDCALRLVFSDGTTQRVDFKEFLVNSSHPQIRSFLDPVKFAQFRIEFGELVWGDFELCFPVADLHQNCIYHHGNQKKAA
jgi:hypothetical protein